MPALLNEMRHWRPEIAPIPGSAAIQKRPKRFACGPPVRSSGTIIRQPVSETVNVRGTTVSGVRETMLPGAQAYIRQAARLSYLSS